MRQFNEDTLTAEVVARLKGLLEPSLNVLEAELRHDFVHQRYRAATFLLRLPSISKAMSATGSSDADKT